MTDIHDEQTWANHLHPLSIFPQPTTLSSSVAVAMAVWLCVVVVVLGEGGEEGRRVEVKGVCVCVCVCGVVRYGGEVRWRWSVGTVSHHKSTVPSSHLSTHPLTHPRLLA